MIQFENVSLSYGAGTVVRNLNFTIQNGEFVAVIGANGAGKTTTAKLMNGLLKPTSGRVLVDGKPTTACKTSELAKKVGFLFQNPDRQLCKMTIREEIAFGLTLTGAKNVQERVEAILQDFDFDGDRDPFSMSRGERQRIALASLIAVEPEVLILDEPTTGLDYLECMAMMTRIRSLNEQGTTVVMVCHDMELVLDFAKRVLVFSDGQLQLDGETRQVFRSETVLDKASVLPPQITRLSERLSDCLPPVDTAEEMEDAVRTKRGEGASK